MNFKNNLLRQFKDNSIRRLKHEFQSIVFKLCDQTHMAHLGLASILQSMMAITKRENIKCHKRMENSFSKSYILPLSFAILFHQNSQLCQF